MPKKKASWNCVNGVLRGDYPDGHVVSLDLHKLFKDYDTMTDAQKLWIEYGRQWPVDNYAGETDLSIKCPGIMKRYDEICEGKIKIKTESVKTRLNNVLQSQSLAKLTLAVEMGIYTQAEVDKEMQRRADEALENGESE